MKVIHHLQSQLLLAHWCRTSEIPLPEPARWRFRSTPSHVDKHVYSQARVIFLGGTAREHGDLLIGSLRIGWKQSSPPALTLRKGHCGVARGDAIKTSQDSWVFSFCLHPKWYDRLRKQRMPHTLFAPKVVCCENKLFQCDAAREIKARPPKQCRGYPLRPPLTFKYVLSPDGPSSWREKVAQ